MNPDGQWNTEAELAFIQTIGTHLPQSANIPRLTWLQRYQLTIDLRHEWGSIDKFAVVRVVKNEIRKEQQRMSRRAV